jgi:hypothetical protein
MTGPQPSSPSPQGRRGGRRRRIEKVGALDMPPPVASPLGGRWKPRRCQVRSPQRLATLQHEQDTAPCDPIILEEQYIVCATNQGELCLFDQLAVPKESSSMEVTTPTFILSLKSDASIMSLSTVYRVSTNSDDNEATLFMVLSVEGDVHMVTVYTDDGSPSLHLFCSWNTGICGSTCISARILETNRWKVVVGYDSGYVEEWAVSVEPTTKRNEEVEPNLRLLWGGMFDSRIRSVAPLRVAKRKEEYVVDEIPTTQNIAIENENDNKASENEAIEDDLLPIKNKDDTTGDTTSVTSPHNTDNVTTEIAAEEKPSIKTEVAPLQVDEPEVEDISHLVVALQPRDENSANTSASMVEVIDIESITNSWIPAIDAESHDFIALPLNEHWVLPRSGMEILDASTVPSVETEGLPRRAPIIPSHGCNSAIILDGNASCGVTLSDGTVAMLTASRTLGGELFWGIAKDKHQLLLSYPSVACSRVDFAAKGQHIVSCFRGGTAFLIPTEDNDTVEDETDIIVIPYPHDVDSDSSSQFVQGFTAGNLRVRHDDGSLVRMAVLIYSWAGGTVDINACSLFENVQSKSSKDPVEIGLAEKLVLQEMIDNGTLSILCNLLHRMADSDEQLDDPLWKDARDEYLATPPPFVSRSLETICSESFGALRPLLLSLAST